MSDNTVTYDDIEYMMEDIREAARENKLVHQDPSVSVEYTRLPYPNTENIVIDHGYEKHSILINTEMRVVFHSYEMRTQCINDLMDVYAASAVPF